MRERELGRRMRGQELPGTKLTEADVQDIRAASRAGSGMRPLAERYGVSRTNIQMILRRETWAWVEDAPLAQPEGVSR